MTHEVLRAAGRLLLPLTLYAIGTAGAPGRAGAEPRFGDSTWVAPSAPAEGDPKDPGPRVAEPDHERVWESVLRAPFRVAFFPLRVLARGIEASASTLESRFPSLLASLGTKFTPELIGATVMFPFGQPGLKVALTAAQSISGDRKLRLRGFAGDGVSQIGVGAEALYDYRPNRAFYGIGNFSDSRRTYYRRRTDLASAHVFTGLNHLRRARVTVGLSDVAVESGSGTNPRAVDVFSPAGVPFLTRGSQVWWYGSSANLAVLDDSLSPTRGVHFRPDFKRYRSSDGTGLRYDLWRLEARGYLPVFAKRRVLAGRLVYEGVDRRDGSALVPFYRLPESTDSDRFAAYPNGRFRDNRLAIGRAEYRWEIMPPIWAVALGELGQVGSTSSRLTLRGAHPSLGGGLRAKVGDRVARFEIARGHEGLSLRFDAGAEF